MIVRLFILMQFLAGACAPRALVQPLAQPAGQAAPLSSAKMTFQEPDLLQRETGVRGEYRIALRSHVNFQTEPDAFKAYIPTVMQMDREYVMIGAGDIGNCSGAPEQTAALLAGYPGATIYTVGDNAYPDATAEDFQRCFDPTWGQYKSRIYPSAGNHEYHTENASGYFNYFGAAAGEPGKGYYSYDLGGWHIIVLNSNCSDVSGCDEGSPQEEWLKADLAAHPAQCTLAYWHEPLFSSGKHGSDSKYRDFWRALYAAGVDLVLNAHEHNYERFAPQDPDGNPDSQNGIREIIIGTGGASLYEVGADREPNSDKVITGVYGLLKLSLYSGRYQWTFLPVEGETASDQGSDVCH